MKRRWSAEFSVSLISLFFFFLIFGSGQQVGATQPLPDPKLPRGAVEERYRLSLVCDPLSKSEIFEKKSMTITVKLHGVDRSPLVGKTIQLRIEHKPISGKIGGPTAPQRKEGVLGGSRNAPISYKVITDENGNGQRSIPFVPLRWATAIRAMVDGQEAICELKN